MRPQDRRAYDSLTEEREALGEAPPTSKAFTQAIEDGLVDRWAAGELSKVELDDAVRATEAHLDREHRAQRKRRAFSTAVTRENYRMSAATEILALDAARSDEVVDFRRDVLRNRLRKVGRVHSWVKQTASEVGPPTKYGLFALQAGSTTSVEGKTPVEWSRKLLHYFSEDQRVSVPDCRNCGFPYGAAEIWCENCGVPLGVWEQSIPVTAGKTLDRLRLISEQLSQRYRWRVAAVSTFVITGITPRIPPARILQTEPWPFNQLLRTVSLLEIPPTTRPEEVARIYKEARDEMLRGQPHQRLLQSKQRAELAVFAARHNTGHKWSTLREMWEEQNPGTKYKQLGTFIRDARQAYERVMGEKLDWAGIEPTKKEAEE